MVQKSLVSGIFSACMAVSFYNVIGIGYGWEKSYKNQQTDFYQENKLYHYCDNHQKDNNKLILHCNDVSLSLLPVIAFLSVSYFSFSMKF